MQKSTNFVQKTRTHHTDMKKKYTDLFIDFDDTLYDTRGNADIALRELYDLYRWSQNIDDPERFYARYWETNIDLWSRYAQGEISRQYLIIERFRRPLSIAHGLDLSEAYCLEVSDTFLDLCSSKSGVIKGAHQLIAYLRQQGYRLHLCSNGFHEVQYKKLAACGMRDSFDTIILSEDAGANKPSKQYFDYALTQSHATRETTLMIGDNLQTDILGAKHAGIDTLYFNPQHTEAHTTESPTYQVHSLAQITGIL